MYVIKARDVRNAVVCKLAKPSLINLSNPATLSLIVLICLRSKQNFVLGQNRLGLDEKRNSSTHCRFARADKSQKGFYLQHSVSECFRLSSTANYTSLKIG